MTAGLSPYQIVRREMTVGLSPYPALGHDHEQGGF